MGAVDDDLVAVYKAIISEGAIVVGFNRAAGQQDVAVTLDLTVQDTDADAAGKAVRKRSNATIEEFQTCMGQLMQQPGMK